MPPLYELTPQPFDPVNDTAAVGGILEDIAQEDKEMEEHKAGGPPFKREKTYATSKDESKAVVRKRQVKAAKDIAATCQWVLRQLDNGRIRRSFDDEFTENHFADTHLTNVEVKWLEDHNSLEKVLSISSLAYASAPKWEAFPKSTLSVEDLKRIEEEKVKHMKAIAEADELGRSLLVRIGENAGDRPIIDIGKGGTAWIAEQLSKKRNKSTATKKKAGPAIAAAAAVETAAATGTAATSAVPPTVAEDNRCAVEECIESSIAGVCTDANCAGRHFCDLHLCHNSHSNHRLRVPQVSTDGIIFKCNHNFIT